MIGLNDIYDRKKAMTKLTERQKSIVNFVLEKENVSISDIKEQLGNSVSTPTLNRDLSFLVENHCLLKTGKGRATSYGISPSYHLFSAVDASDYFDVDPDNRKARTGFNFDIISVLKNVDLFTSTETKHLDELKKQYQKNISDYPQTLYQKELERLTIELSWKSSQIEGNTYSLLETERLFLEKEEAQGKPKEDAEMLLNHKFALNYILGNKDIAKRLDLRLLEEVHSLLIQNLGVGRNIRSRTVGITGTAYKPLDNEFQIKETLENMCNLINAKSNGFEKALLAVALISYIQPFEDGNKRTARMISNALLIETGICPLSYRSVDSIDYKKAMLLFYEQNNISAFKQMFIEQIEFSVKNYFQ